MMYGNSCTESVYNGGHPGLEYTGHCRKVTIVRREVLILLRLNSMDRGRVGTKSLAVVEGWSL